MKKCSCLIIIFNLIIVSKIVAQTDSIKQTFIGGSLQVYPVGIIATVHTEIE